MAASEESSTQGGHGADAPSMPPSIPTDRPTSARAYGWVLGGKDNFEVDRQHVFGVLDTFPEAVDSARENRLFLYRAVRHLARDLGITQFLDLGSGLPTDQNVHQVAQLFRPESRVVYVDNDPIVAAHGRALLADDATTTVIEADMTRPQDILDHEDTRRLIDFTRPLAVLMLAVPHCIPDDDTARRAVLRPVDYAVPGSHLVLTHVVADTPAVATELTDTMVGLGLPWKTRLPSEVDTWLAELEPLPPGLCDINDWRPDPDQPPLPPLDPRLQPYSGASARMKRIYEYGGLLRKN
jgi:hypothetical protein